MDTILNLGLNDEVVEGVEKLTGNARFAYDSYRRFIQMYADVVMGLNKARFEDIIDEVKKEKGITDDLDLDADDMKKLVVLFKNFYEEELNEPFQVIREHNYLVRLRPYSVLGIIRVPFIIAR